MNNIQEIIFDFNKNTIINNWRIVDDVVMGGRSNGNFKINNQGHGEFSGTISLENNGGFSSLRYRFKPKEVKNYQYIILKVKGDSKKYQFRVKDNLSNYYSFIANFETTEEWQTIKIRLSDMYPAFRGRTLNMDNFSSKKIEEIAFLIGNKKAENFKLEIDAIYFQ